MFGVTERAKVWAVDATDDEAACADAVGSKTEIVDPG
jgi:hypothetical protein